MPILISTADRMPGMVSVYVESGPHVDGVVVTARPILSPAVRRPRQKMISRKIFVFRRICRSHNRNAGISAVVMSIMEASTPLTCCDATSNCPDLQLPPGTSAYAARKGVQ